ncbi:low-density lipoprotein receptor, putative [Pediculus humanus corporis]|uniref:Low-density lipoprotein receptor, putative n=1 Tax=Pediculus humanus subsp. corporis TaxID=121224 RepID=E0VBL6_PEDHC|nr:low-density lipoprotein receptor, putative [Pediculus humanus corporis]EEB10772.1 low-density lipoprotein receptor, putative [Pediculus humanus corporis]
MVKNTSEESMTNEEEITEKNDGLKNEESNDDNWNVKNPSENGESFSDPFQHQKEHIENFESVTATEGGGQVEEQTQMTTTTIETMVPKFKITGNQENIWRDVDSISLGFPCTFDSQCQREDTESKCINGICDCVVKNNGTNLCDKDNTGCAPETFQCRSSGLCISWFFVCDGRNDCPDGSDEQCQGPVCPSYSFQCSFNGTCVSLAVLCDGKKNCPNGEDEKFCMAEHRKESKNCPENTFQCGNGQCLPKYEFCNAIPKCADGTDESPELCRSDNFNRNYYNSEKKTINLINNNNDNYCPMKCENGRCRSTAILCSGRDGCGDNSDESQCSVCRCPKISRIRYDFQIGFSFKELFSKF